MKFLSIALIVLAFTFYSTARAEGEANEHAKMGAEHKEETMPTWEISGGATASFDSTTASSQSTQTYSIMGDADYFIVPQVEFGLHTEIGIEHATGSTTSSFEFLLGPTYNLCKDIDHSFFVQARAGIILNYYGVGIPNTARFAYLADIGKRFLVVENVTYMPTIGFGGTGKSNKDGYQTASTTHWEIVPLQFAFTI